MKRVIASRLLVLVGGLCLAASAFAQSKVGIVSFQNALLGTKEIQKKQSELETKFKPLQDEIEKLQRDLQEIQSKLTAQRAQLSPQAAADLQSEGQFKQHQLHLRQKYLRDEGEEKLHEILSAAQQKLVWVVQKVAETKGLDVVVDATNVVYSKPALDITADVIAEFDKQYPAQ